MNAEKRLRILWLTNLPAPYRFPIWSHMARSADLKVVFLLKRKNWRNWPEPKNTNWQHFYLSFHSLRFKEYDLIPSFRGGKKLLKEIDIAIIGGWEAPFYIRTILLAKKRNIPIIQFYYSFDGSHRFKSGVIARLRKWILTKPDKYVVISTQSAQALIDMGISQSKILTLFNPVDVRWFNDFANQNRDLNKIGHQFITVGQFIERKNLENIVRAFSEIRSLNDTLTIAGEGPLEKDLINLVELLGLSESVIFVGQKNREDLAKLYASSKTLILASTNEVWGLVVNEALACGLHVVVSEYSGVFNFVKSMESVYACNSEIASIAKSMTESRMNWIGPIKTPKILEFSPERFADQLVTLFR